MNLGKHSARFWAKVEKQPRGCWIWTGTRTPRGYGQFSIDNRHYTAHRLAFEDAGGIIPEGLVCDHLCRNRACVNPAHIEPVTNAENVRRGISPIVQKARHAKVTHCPKGHAYTPENTRIGSRNGRQCRTCDRERPNKRAIKLRKSRAIGEQSNG